MFCSSRIRRLSTACNSFEQKTGVSVQNSVDAILVRCDVPEPPVSSSWCLWTWDPLREDSVMKMMRNPTMTSHHGAGS